MSSLKRKKQASTKSRHSVSSTNAVTVNSQNHDTRTRRRGFGAFHFKSERLINKLITSVDNDDVTGVQECIDSGVDINNTNVLRVACSRGSSDVVATLLRGGASVNVRGDSGSVAGPLYLAARRGSMPIIAVLLSNGANVNMKTHFEGRTPLHAVAINDHQDCVGLLLDNGAEVNAADIYGCTPLHLAARAGRNNIVDTLFKYGAVSDPVDNDGWTPLHLTAESGQVATLKILLDKGAKINKQNRYGRTPLHWACASNQISVVKMLLQEGADFNIKDSHGKCAHNYVSNLRLINVMKDHQSKTDQSTIAYTSGVGLLVQIDRRMCSAINMDSEEDNSSGSTSIDSGSCISPTSGAGSTSPVSIATFTRTHGFRRRRRNTSITSELAPVLRRIDTESGESPIIVDTKKTHSQLVTSIDTNTEELQTIMKFLCTSVSGFLECFYVTRAIDANVREDQLEQLRATYTRIQRAQNLLSDFVEEANDKCHSIRDQLDRLSSAEGQSWVRYNGAEDAKGEARREYVLLANNFYYVTTKYLASIRDSWKLMIQQLPLVEETCDNLIRRIEKEDEDETGRTMHALSIWSRVMRMNEKNVFPVLRLLLDIEKMNKSIDSSAQIIKLFIQSITNKYKDLPKVNAFIQVASKLGKSEPAFCAHLDCATNGLHNDTLTLHHHDCEWLAEIWNSSEDKNTFIHEVALSLIRSSREDLLSVLFKATSEPLCSNPSTARSSPLSFNSNSSTNIIDPHLFLEN